MGSIVVPLLQRSPAFVKRQALALLFRATAQAFGCETPSLSGLSWEQRLVEYARFTSQRAGAALRQDDGAAGLQERLYRNAYRLGRTPGRLLRVHRVGDVMTLGRFLYGILDIDFVGNEGGDITIGRCYFSSHYSPEVCRLMSAMDRGLLAGLAGGGDLVFTQRITEGQCCCLAHFTLAAGRRLAGPELEQPL